jgi:hypothetical protein
MHIITYTTRSGTIHNIQHVSSVYAFALIKRLRKNSIPFTHHFEE